MLTFDAFAEPVRETAFAARIAKTARQALVDELETWPKPGLVSLVDSGSHDDMNAAMLLRSAAAIEPFFARLVAAGADGDGMPVLRGIGIEAEAAMMTATGGVNAHRGAIFSLGLLCAGEGAGHHSDASAEDRAMRVSSRWGAAIDRTPASCVSHGGRAALHFGVGGASAEAASGFPTVRAVGLPALRAGRLLAPGYANAARVQCFFALLAQVDDTNLLHRGGRAGLIDAQIAAARFLADGGVAATGWLEAAVQVHRSFVARRLSPGGCADLLAVTLFLEALGGPT